MLETKRTILRNLCKTDVDTLFAYRNDPRCSRYQRYDDTSKAYLQQFVEKFSQCQFLSTEEEQHYAIVSKETGDMMGDVSIFYTEKDRCFTVGITIAPSYQGQGYGYEILKELVKQLQAGYPTLDIVALIEKENTKSIALFRKLGFIEECYAESIASFVFTKPGKSMTAEELWQAFIREKNIPEEPYDAWAFGEQADCLAQLVLRGEKTATASAYPLYELEGEPLPAVGEYSVILDAKDTAVCVIQTTNVTVVPFCDVSAEHAFREGEGDKSLDFWRRGHRRFFTACMEDAGLQFAEDMKVVCEEFVVMYP